MNLMQVSQHKDLIELHSCPLKITTLSTFSLYFWFLEMGVTSTEFFFFFGGEVRWAFSLPATKTTSSVNLSLWQASSSLSPNNRIGSPLSLSLRMTFESETRLKSVNCHLFKNTCTISEDWMELQKKIIKTSSLGIIADLASPSSFFLLNAKNMSSSAVLFPAFS